MGRRWMDRGSEIAQRDFRFAEIFSIRIKMLEYIGEIVFAGVGIAFMAALMINPLQKRRERSRNSKSFPSIENGERLEENTTRRIGDGDQIVQRLQDPDESMSG